MTRSILLASVALGMMASPLMAAEDAICKNPMLSAADQATCSTKFTAATTDAERDTLHAQFQTKIDGVKAQAKDAPDSMRGTGMLDKGQGLANRSGSANNPPTLDNRGTDLRGSGALDKGQGATRGTGMENIQGSDMRGSERMPPAGAAGAGRGPK